MQLPLTAVLLLFELTHDYFIIIPTLASVGISYWVASFPLASVLEPLSRLLASAPSSVSISASQVLSGSLQSPPGSLQSPPGSVLRPSATIQPTTAGRALRQ